MGRTAWEESSLTEGVGDTKELLGVAGRTCLPPLCRCWPPWSWRCRSMLRMRRLVGILTPEALLFTDSSWRHIGVFLLFFSLLCFSHTYVWNGRKSLRLCRASATTWKKSCCARDLGSPGYRWGEVSKHGRMVNAWRVHFARKLKKRQASNYGIRCGDNSDMCIFRGYITTVFSRNLFFRFHIHYTVYFVGFIQIESLNLDNIRPFSTQPPGDITTDHHPVWNVSPWKPDISFLTSFSFTKLIPTSEQGWMTWNHDCLPGG